MFISCQNDNRTQGRKELPSEISKKLGIFEYPKPIQADLNK
jgi:hypothetical protein